MGSHGGDVCRSRDPFGRMILIYPLLADLIERRAELGEPGGGIGDGLVVMR